MRAGFKGEKIESLKSDSVRNWEPHLSGAGKRCNETVFQED